MTSTDVPMDVVPSSRRKSLRRRIRGQVAPVLYAAALAFWAASWNLRLSVLMAWMPVEPIWLASLAVALCVVHRFGRPVRVDPAVLWPLAVLVLGFLPGALRSSEDGYGPQKVATMIFVLLPVVLASTVLLDSARARRGWLWAQVLVGVSVAVAALTTSHVSFTQPGRFTLATVDTISTARPVGAAAVVLVLFAMTSVRNAWWALPLAIGCGGVLVQVGSRGPLLFALVAIVLVAMAAHCFAGRRALPTVGMIVIAVGAYRYAVADGGSGGQRLLAEGLSDAGRTELLSDAVRAGIAHPFGVGWGDFIEYSQAARGIANAQGVSYAHDAFAEAFSEGGWLALVAFSILVGVSLVRLHRASGHPQEAVLWGVTVYWLLNALVSLDFVGNRYMWITLVAALATSYSAPDPAPGAASRSADG